MNKILTRAARGAGLAFTLAVGQWAYSQSDDVTSRHEQSIAKGTGLSPPSSIPVPTPIQAQELPQLTLTGVAQVGLEKFALLVVDESGKPPQYYKLTEGEQRDGIEVVAIEVASRIVTVRHLGTEILLSFAARKRAQQEAAREQERFNQEHVRAHEHHEQLEREREDRERAREEARAALPQPGSETDY